jgi:hypothetical protein
MSQLVNAHDLAIPHGVRRLRHWKIRRRTAAARSDGAWKRDKLAHKLARLKALQAALAA